MPGCLESISSSIGSQRFGSYCAIAELIIAIALIIICGVGVGVQWGIPAIASTGAVGGLFSVLAIATLIYTCKSRGGSSTALGTSRVTLENTVKGSETISITPVKKAPPKTAPEALEDWVDDSFGKNEKKNRRDAADKILACYSTKAKVLDLKDLEMTSLPAAIGVFLVNVETLDLSGNHLFCLPAEIKELIFLRQLDLSRNAFIEFPAELKELDTLHTLILANNRISSLNSEQLTIGLMSNLRVLDLSGNLIQIDIPDYTVDQMKRLSEALTIDLRGNKLIYPEVKERLDAPGTYSPYEPIILFDGSARYNEKEKGISVKREEGLKPAPKDLSQLNEWVNAAFGVELEARKVAAAQIEKCYKNRETSLKLTMHGLTSLPPAIGTLDHLELLNISGNSLTSLPSEFGNLSRLQELNLSYNKLTEFPEALCHLHDLCNLDMNNNQIVTLPPRVSRISNLRKFDLTHNNIATVSDETLKCIKRLSPKLTIWINFNPVGDNRVENNKLQDFKKENAAHPSFNLPILRD